MKLVYLLESDDALQEGDMVIVFPWGLYNVNIGDLYWRTLGKDVSCEDREFAVRPLPELQWQTGKVPEPTTLCICVLESEGMEVDGITRHELVRSLPTKNGYKWQGETNYSPNNLLQLTGYTGRWFIQEINLPCSDPTNQKQ